MLYQPVLKGKLAEHNTYQPTVLLWITDDKLN